MDQQKTRMQKRQFRIGDLSKELKVKKFVIRFWEKEFDLQSDRSQGGQRFYSQEDLKTFSLIKNLLYKQKFTIPGAKKQLEEILKENKTEQSSQITPAQKTDNMQQSKITEKTVTKSVFKIPKEFLEKLWEFKELLLKFEKHL